MSEEPLLPSEYESRKILENELDELDELWSRYVGRVRQVMDEWEKVKVRLLERISKVSSLLKAVNEDLEKINVEIMLGLASEDEKRDEKDKLESMKNKLENRLKALQEFLETVESRIIMHGERLATA